MDASSVLVRPSPSGKRVEIVVQCASPREASCAAITLSVKTALESRGQTAPAKLPKPSAVDALGAEVDVRGGLAGAAFPLTMLFKLPAQAPPSAPASPRLTETQLRMLQARAAMAELERRNKLLKEQLGVAEDVPAAPEEAPVDAGDSVSLRFSPRRSGRGFLARQRTHLLSSPATLPSIAEEEGAGLEAPCKDGAASRKSSFGDGDSTRADSDDERGALEEPLEAAC